MRITSWNARGLIAPSKKRLIKQYLKIFNSKIILIQETKLSKIESSKFSMMVGIWDSIVTKAIGASGGLAILWNPRRVVIKHLVNNNNWLCVSI